MQSIPLRTQLCLVAASYAVVLATSAPLVYVRHLQRCSAALYGSFKVCLAQNFVRVQIGGKNARVEAEMVI
jgi:hypothetical protein